MIYVCYIAYCNIDKTSAGARRRSFLQRCYLERQLVESTLFSKLAKSGQKAHLSPLRNCFYG